MKRIGDVGGLVLVALSGAAAMLVLTAVLPEVDYREPVTALLPTWEKSKEIIAAFISGGMTIIGGAFVLLTARTQRRADEFAEVFRRHQELQVVFYHSTILISVIKTSYDLWIVLNGASDDERYRALYSAEQIVRIADSMAAQIRSGRTTFTPVINNSVLNLEIMSASLRFEINTCREKYTISRMPMLRKVGKTAIELLQGVCRGMAATMIEMHNLNPTGPSPQAEIDDLASAHDKAWHMLAEAGIIEVDPRPQAT